MEEALNAITLVEIRQKLEDLDAEMTACEDDVNKSLTYVAAAKAYCAWEALVDRVLHGEMITERPV